MDIDHIVLAAADLERAKAEFAAATGVTPVDGGPHPGGGTCNALVSFGNGCYLEIIAPDPKQSLAGTNGERFAAYTETQLLHWAVRCDDLEATALWLKDRGARPTAIRDMARDAPNGQQLRWRLMGVRAPGLDGLMPFFIDWQDTPHPAATAPSVGDLRSIGIGLSQANPCENALLEVLKGLDAGRTNVRMGGSESTNESTGMKVEFESPRGLQVYESATLAGFGF